MVFRLLSPYNGNHCFCRQSAHCTIIPHTYYAHTTAGLEPWLGKYQHSPIPSLWPLLIFYGEPTALFYDLGLGHLQMLGARIISNDGPRSSNFYAADWTATSAKGVLEQRLQFLEIQFLEVNRGTSQADWRDCSESKTWFRCSTSRSRARNHGCDDQAMWGLEEGWWGRSQTRPRGREGERLSFGNSNIKVVIREIEDWWA